MSLRVDSTNYARAGFGSGSDGVIVAQANEAWDFDGTAPTVTTRATASGYASVAATDASGGSTHCWGFDTSAHMGTFISSVGSIQAALIAKGIIY